MGRIFTSGAARVELACGQRAFTLAWAARFGFLDQAQARLPASWGRARAPSIPLESLVQIEAFQ